MEVSSMRFSKIVLFSSSLVLAGSIVVRAISPVNHNEVNIDQNSLLQVNRAPLPPPYFVANTTLFADGAPLPPPHFDGRTTLVVDGAPLPPPHTDIASIVNS
jgi:hypothetical protein